MAQLAERSLPIPEVRGSNPVIGEILCIPNMLLLTVEKTKRKEAGNGPIVKKEIVLDRV